VIKITLRKMEKENKMTSLSKESDREKDTILKRVEKL
jgi:hypothetical protein